MQLRKLIAAGSMSLLMAGSTLAFAGDLSKYPEPFVTSTGVQSLVVVGATANPADVVGAVDLAARLGGSVTQDVAVAGTAGNLNIVGEGKQVATSSTKVFLDDDMGKTGLRNTFTKDDLPTLLKTDTLTDSDVSINSIYQQFIYLTPGDTSSANYDMQFDQHGTTSIDPEYNFGEFTTSPTNSDYFYRTYVTFDKGVNSTAAGEKVTFFGKTYTIHSDTIFSGTTPKLVLSGGSDTILLKGGETKTVTISGTAYEVSYIASSDSSTGIVRVGSDQKSLAQGKSSKVGGLDVYMDRVFDVSSTDPTQDSAQLLLGSEKLVLQDGQKVKTGDNEDSVEGTYVNLTISVTSGASRLDAFSVRIGGRSSADDFLKEGASYLDPVWKTFKLAFPGVFPAKTDTSRSVMTIKPSGDNLMQLEAKDDRGNLKAVTWGYKAASTGTAFSLADTGGKAIHVLENDTIRQDEYFVADAGDFTHLYKVSSLSITSGFSSSDYIELTDIYSGVTTKVNIGADGIETKVIDGQSYYFWTNTTAIKVTWGNNALNSTVGDFTTLFPGIKGQKGEYWHFYAPGQSLTVATNSRVNLPTGAINFTVYQVDAATYRVNVTATPKESGTASALATSPLSINASAGASGAFTLGRTVTGGLIYNLTVISNTNTTANVNLSIVGDSGAIGILQPGVLLVEEKDDSSNQYSVFVSATTESSGSNSVAIPAAPSFTATEDSSTGSDSTITHYVDLYGVYAKRTTSSQDTVTLYYPDEQAFADIAVTASAATADRSGSASGSTVKHAVPVKTALGKLDLEVSTADKTTQNLILVGGPCVNTLVRELATEGKIKKGATDLTCDNWISMSANGDNFGIIHLVDSAWTAGKSALVVAGSTAVETRQATSILQKYDEYKTQLAAKNAVLVRGTTVTDLA